MQEFFSIAGAVMLLLLCLALVIAAAGYAINAWQWSYYRGLRRQIVDTVEMLEAEFTESQKFHRGAVVHILAKLHNREWPNADKLRWLQGHLDKPTASGDKP